MKMQIVSAKIENFKGITLLEADFSTTQTVISGDNETGKSTIADAFTYCLTGKTYEGNSNFGIKPVFASEIISPSVEFECLVNEKPVNLKRVYQAKFARDKSFKSYETQCFINGLPTSVKDFEIYVNSIAENENFKLLTIPLHFVEQMIAGKGETIPQKQRRLLFELAKLQTDRELIEQHPEYLELANVLIRYSDISQYFTFTKTQIRKLNKMIEEFPVKIKQQALNFIELDFEPAQNEKEMQTLSEQIHATNNSLSELSQNNTLNSTQALMHNAQAQIRLLQEQNQKSHSDQQLKYEQDLNLRTSELSSNARKYENVFFSLRTEHSQKSQTLQNKINERTRDLQQLELNLQRLRIEHKELLAKDDRADNICPTCKRDYPVEEVKNINKLLAETKNKKIAENTETGKAINGEIIAIKNEIMRLNAETTDLSLINQTKITELQQQIEDTDKQISTIRNNQKPCLISDIKDFKENIEKLNNQIATFEKQLEVEQIEIDTRKSEFQTFLESLSNQMNECKVKQNKVIANSMCQNLIAELEKQKKETNTLLDELQRPKDLAENFLHLKSTLATEQINSLFEYITWELFRFTQDDGLIETCVPVFNGVPYINLSLSTRIICGLDIIKAFQKRYNTYLPIIIDNTETINFAESLDCQSIMFKRIDEDCPKCGNKSGRKQSNGLWECKECGHQFKKHLTIKS